MSHPKVTTCFGNDMTTCKNCNNLFEGNYCSSCGQKNYSDSDKHFSSILKETFHYFTHFEGSIFTTLKAIYAHPAKLSLDYCNGVRKKYFKPVSFYLLIVAIYLILPIAKGLNVPLQIQEKTYTGEWIKKQVIQKMSEKNISIEQFTEQYSHTSAKVSKILLLIFIPYSTLLLYFLFHKQKRLVYDLTIFSTEINIFFITTFFLLFPLLLLGLTSIFAHLFISEVSFSIISDTIFILYSSIFFWRAFQNSWWLSLLKSLIFNFLYVIFYLTVYRFLLFEISYILI
jgi:hypothetical protein